MMDKISTIKIHQSTKKELEKLKLTPGESYENIIKRLIVKFEDENMRTLIIEGTKDTIKFDGEYNGRKIYRSNNLLFYNVTLIHYIKFFIF